MMYLFPLVLIAVIALPLLYAYRQKVNGKAPSAIKKTMIFNLSAFALVILASIILPFGGFAAAATVDASTISVGGGLAYIAAALATGLSGIGAGVAVAAGSAAAIGAITEEPKVFGRAILFVGLGEGIAIYGFVISILLWIKF